MIFPLALLVTWGCTPAETRSSTPLPEITSDPTPPSLTAQDFSDQLATALHELPDPGEALDYYVELMSFGDSTCPGDPLHMLDNAAHGCTSEDGYFFSGVTYYEAGEWDDGEVYVYETLAGDFWITSPNAEEFIEGGGHVVRAESESERNLEVQGSWNASLDTQWLADGFSGVFQATLYDAGFSLYQAAISSGAVTFAISDVTVYAECDWEGEGLFELRDENGNWYWMELSACDPCGEVWVGDESIGTTCLDLSGLNPEGKGG